MLPNFKVTLTTRINPESQLISQSVEDEMGNISRKLMSLQEEQVRTALMKLGWTPPAPSIPREKPDQPPRATACCRYTPKPGIPWPVFWNPFNKVVQCHNCGQIYEPKN